MTSQAFYEMYKLEIERNENKISIISYFGNNTKYGVEYNLETKKYLSTIKEIDKEERKKEVENEHVSRSKRWLKSRICDILNFKYNFTEGNNVNIYTLKKDLKSIDILLR